MSTPSRTQAGRPLPSFEGEAQAFPEQERAGAEPSALGIAIAEACFSAAEYLHANDMHTMTFEVTRISVVVEPNPGPTTYRAIISPGG